MISTYIVRTKQIEGKEEEIKQYHRKRLYELSLKSLGEIPLLDDPNEEQKESVIRRMKAPARSWKRCVE